MSFTKKEKKKGRSFTVGGVKMNHHVDGLKMAWLLVLASKPVHNKVKDKDKRWQCQTLACIGCHRKTGQPGVVQRLN